MRRGLRGEPRPGPGTAEPRGLGRWEEAVAGAVLGAGLGWGRMGWGDEGNAEETGGAGNLGLEARGVWGAGA